MTIIITIDQYANIHVRTVEPLYIGHLTSKCVLLIEVSVTNCGLYFMLSTCTHVHMYTCMLLELCVTVTTTVCRSV